MIGIFRYVLFGFFLLGPLSRAQDAFIPERPKPLLELGDPYLGTGEIRDGFKLPTGAVWQPSLIVFGRFQSSLYSFKDEEETYSDWANRLDLFGNLQLTGTERLMVGIRPLDDGHIFSGYNFEGEPTGWQDGFDNEVHTLFFEGDVSQLFPMFDRRDRHSTDWGFSVGRQPMLVQDGILINDDIDSVGLVRNNRLTKHGSNFRHTFFYGWDEIHRGDNQETNSVDLYGLFNQYDGAISTLEMDLVYVDDAEGGTDGFHWGLGSLQRIGHQNFTLRVLGSHALDEKSPSVNDGFLLFQEWSTTLPHSHDLVYLNAFWGIDSFTSASRGPDRGGPLGRSGILFDAVGLGRYAAPLGNQAEESVGGAVGIQKFFAERRRNLILELGGRTSTDSEQDEAAGAVGARYQQAFGRRFVLQLDAFGAWQEKRDEKYGGRAAMRVEF